MPKGQYQRKLRRVDYSKNEIAAQLNVGETTVDSRIAQFCKDYNLPDGMFKRDGGDGLNFFPPEYTPLLIELLKNNADNPALPRARKHEKATAEDVVSYYNKLKASIEGNKEIPEYLTKWISEMPWMRTANDVSELLELLATELQVFIHNVLDTQNSDVGQGLRMIVRNLDIVNYRMFQGNQMYRMARLDNEELKKQNEEGLYNELKNMTEEEREAYFREVPTARAIYNEYAVITKKDNGVRLDAQDLSLDQGLIETIKTLMSKGDGNQLKYGYKMKLDEFSSDGTVFASVDEERAAYMEANKSAVLAALENGRSSGEMNYIKSGRKWKCIADKIKDRETIDDVFHPGGVEHFNENLEEYLEYFDDIRQNDTMLKEIVSNFVGRLMVDFLFASNKK